MSQVEKQTAVALVSGSASTAFEIYKATLDGRLSRTELGGVISSRPEAGSLKRFQDGGFPLHRFFEVRPENYRNREEYGEALMKAIKVVNPDIIGQYGHTPLTPENVIVDFTTQPGKAMINQHPGPIDPGPYDFGGEGMSSAARTHAARLIFVRETRRKDFYWTEVTAQRVATVFDGGKVLKRGRVPILPDDTVQSLNDRAIVEERKIQVATLKDFEDGTVEELPPYRDLVLPGERFLLQVIKRLVRHLYPPEK